MENNNPIQASIIIPVFNDYKRLEICLELLTQQTGNLSFEILVVDNCSSNIDQNVINKFRNFSSIHFLTEKKVGSYAARNKGLTAAKGPIIAFTDSDCMPALDWLEKLVALFEESHCDLIAGNVIVVTSDNAKLTLLETYERVLAFPQEENAKLGRSVTANLAVKRIVINNIGTFDDEALSGADHEFSNRAVKAGYKLVYGQHCCISHPARKQLHQMRQKLRRTVGGFYHLRLTNPEMAHKLTWLSILKDIAPPFNALKETLYRKDELQLTPWYILKVMIVATHNKWYRMWLKLQLKFGLTEFIER